MERQRKKSIFSCTNFISPVKTTPFKLDTSLRIHVKFVCLYVNKRGFFSDDVNWDKISEELSAYNWDKEFHKSDNRSSMIDKFYEICYTICENIFLLESQKVLTTTKSEYQGTEKT